MPGFPNIPIQTQRNFKEFTTEPDSNLRLGLAIYWDRNADSLVIALRSVLPKVIHRPPFIGELLPSMNLNLTKVDAFIPVGRCSIST